MKETTFSKADSQEIVDAFVPPSLNEEEKHLIEKFFTNLDKSVYSIFLLPPEIAGALCSKTSRSRDDLRKIFLNEFIKPFLESEYGKSLQEFIEFLQKSDALKKIFNNPKARDFYSRWLAEYGDDSIAQMAGSYVIFSGLSQIAIKHFENQRIGLAPIEKSTRYVDFSVKINNHYPYFFPPEIKETNLYNEYQETMDYVFKTYSKLYEKYFNYLKQVFPNEKEIVLKTKSFDVMRLILPMATLGQVAFFGNGQAFEYAINRSLNNTLEEIRWAGKRIKEELDQITPSFLRRIEKEESFQYRKYLSERKERIDNFLEKNWQKEKKLSKEEVKLLEYDPKGEDKIIAGLIYPETKEDFLSVINKVEKMPQKQKEDLLNEVLKDRKFRWQKIPRAFENVYVLWEIVSNIGAWRDIQRHRMHTQYHQRFNIYLGYDIPQELENVSLKNLKNKFVLAIKKLEELYKKLEKINPELSQYAVSFAHKIRFIQYQNLREVFWETELRTTSQGHPDYRKIEQMKARKIMEVYPLIKKYLLVDFNDYSFARREYKNQDKMTPN
ncbi:MAG: FAD-dependent thymidylate synthase [Patescibacteria group bacterium]|nr:FAD-dependent thymidylate synthase [Patescibacteria group bacterium]